jgi:hypothetical protein
VKLWANVAFFHEDFTKYEFLLKKIEVAGEHIGEVSQRFAL